jgi:hypothetical protein
MEKSPICHDTIYVLLSNPNMEVIMASKSRNSVINWPAPGTSKKMTFDVINDGNKITFVIQAPVVLTAQNEKFSRVGKNVAEMYKTLSPEYIQDLNYYCHKYFLADRRSKKLAMNAHSLFAKLIWKLAATYPNVNPETITRQEIIDAGYPIITLQNAIEKGLLQRVKCTHPLSAQM